MSDFDRLITQLHSPNQSTRQNAVYKLGKGGDECALPWLEKSAEDTSRVVRCRAAKALANFPNDGRSIQILESLLSDPDEEVYGCTCRALSQIKSLRAVELLLEHVLHDSKHGRNIASNNLIGMGERVIEPVVAAYQTAEGEAKAYLLKILGRTGGDQQRHIFIDALADPNHLVSWVARAIHRTRRDSGAVPVLIALLAHEDPKCRLRAIYALNFTPDKRASRPLQKIATDENHDYHVRLAAIEALQTHDSGAAIRPLLRLLKFPDTEVQKAAYTGLARTGCPDVVPLIINIANHFPDSGWHHNVIRSFGYYGDKKTLRALKRLRAGKVGFFTWLLCFFKGVKVTYDARILLTMDDAIALLETKLEKEASAKRAG